MKRIVMAVAALGLAATAGADTYVKGHVKADGTYVPGHFKTEANTTKLDNYSTKGNTNPYTGKAGTVDPYKVPAPSYQPAPAPKPSTATCLRDIVTGKCI